MIWSYEEYGRMPGFAASAVRPEHLAASRRLYDGDLDWRSLNAALPSTVPEMLRQRLHSRARRTGRAGSCAAHDPAGRTTPIASRRIQRPSPIRT